VRGRLSDSQSDPEEAARWKLSLLEHSLFLTTMASSVSQLLVADAGPAFPQTGSCVGDKQIKSPNELELELELELDRDHLDDSLEDVVEMRRHRLSFKELGKMVGA